MREDLNTNLPLLTSKLAAAPLPDPVVARPRLLRQLDAGAAGPLTLVVAPAGWGKTTLLGSWFRDHHAPLAWLTIEPAADAPRLWAYLHAALRSTEEHGELPAPGGTIDDAYLIQLAAALARRPQSVTLIIDDLHRIDDPAVIDGIDFLLGHADDRLRLVAAARTDAALPLHRWRLTGELTELHATDLAFTAAEAAELLAEQGIGLPTGHVAQLQARTEGWPVGLRLAARSLTTHPDPARFVEEFGGNHPDIAAYLAEEVLADLPAEARDALTLAAVAPRFDAALVNAVTGRTDGDELLQAAARSSGFIIPLDTRPAAYRCHRLLGELLRAEIHRRTAQEVRDLRRRAARWYAQHDQPAAALQQALAAGDWDQAVEIFTARWRDLTIDHRADDKSLPDPLPPAETVRAEPELALGCAVERLGSDDQTSAAEHLRQAEQQSAALHGERRRRFQTLLLATRLAGAEAAGDGPVAADLARRLLDLLPPEPPVDDAASPDPGTRALARCTLGAATLTAGDLTAAETELADGLRHAEPAGLPRVLLACASRLAFVQAGRGQLRAAEETARTAMAVPLDGDFGRAQRSYVHLALALVAYHRDRPDEAEANLALVDGEPVTEDAAATQVALLRAQLLQDRGDLTASHQALLAGRKRMERAAAPLLVEEFAAAEARLNLARGNAEPVLLAAWTGQDGAAPPPRLAVVLARAHLLTEDPRAAARTAPGWDTPEGESWPLPLRLEAGLIEAVAARHLGDQRRAKRLLERVLQLAEPEGFRRVFRHTDPAVRDLLTAHLDSGTAYWPLVSELTAADAGTVGGDAIPSTLAVEPLTERELTVLRYLQSILSNVEIARELSLSVNTVKTHVRNIYRKLDATRRRDAVRRARDLRLL
ncbi:MAG TPA: LuxR C-terminal-related transcriptional regulator [Micromonosporaceae bacterium]|nr:LuxR C-terminal-related transcriptional regulator [Micromonosporaceae bacterium]